MKPERVFLAYLKSLSGKCKARGEAYIFDNIAEEVIEPRLRRNLITQKTESSKEEVVF